MTTTGKCLCGSTTFAFEGETAWECYCHCDDCRRNCAAPVVGWLGVPDTAFKWTGQEPRTYQSSPGVQRHFCSTCGTPMGFVAAHYPGGMHLYAATLDDPANFNPTFHVNWSSKLPWLVMEDDLKKYDTTLLHAPSEHAGY